MVCVGHTNSCPAHPGYYPPRAARSWIDGAIGTNDEVKATHFNEMVTYIESERVRWITYYNAIGGSAYTYPGWPPGTKTTSDIIYASDYALLRLQLMACVGGGSYGYAAYYTGNLIYAGDETYGYSTDGTREIRQRINELRTWCICNCNYACTCNCNYCVCNCNYACTCNCNYCVCNCNYCTCNCNYCTCNCNYSCTCNCNYSCPCNCNESGTCVIAGSLILMSDGTWKKIEDIQVGDMVQSIFGPVAVDKLDPTTLGDRRMMTFGDESLFWSEEHPMWVRKDGKEWWWSAGPDMWFRELRNGITIGLKDNLSIMSGLDNNEFATLKGWEYKDVVVSNGWSPETPLYSFGAGGAPIIVNGYVMTSHTNEFIFDYTKIRWSEVYNEIYSN